MKKNLYYYFIVAGLILWLFPLDVNANIKLPAIFGDNMVLQQQTNAAIWGKATQNKTVRVTTSWNNKNYSTKANQDGDWKLTVQTPAAGGPYTIVISDGKKIILENVLIGEVWICSGQSNMQMTMQGYPNEPVIGSNKAIATSANNSIRLFDVDRVKSLEPKTDFTGEWLPCIPDNVAQFSAAGYFFADMIQKTLNVPVGIICSSWGGTRIDPWISKDGLKQFDWVTPPEKIDIETFPSKPTVLFNAMISPMVGYAIQGALWYQGESNKNEPAKYEKLMTGLIENWRREWGIGDFSFYYVQIAPFDYSSWGGPSSAFLREAQLKASEATPNTGMACIMDAGDKKSIHPSNKKVVGERLGYLALAKTYGQKGFEYSGPVFKEMTVKGQVAELSFDHAKNGLTTFGKKLENFKIAGDNKHFVPAEAYIKGNKIVLFSPWVEEPVAVRYAFDDYVVGELYNTQGLPASSFRTDDWEIK